MKTRLRLPLTVCTPNLNDWEFEEAVRRQIENSFSANIIEGLVIKYPADPALYNFFSEINIDSDKTWNVFKALAMNMPDDVALIYHHIDDEPKYGEYREKYEIFNFLETYQYELSNDAYIRFGLIHNSEDLLEEVFVNENKRVQFWGIDEDRFLKTMAQFEIFPETDLNFIDEFPVQRTVLTHLNADCIETSALITVLEKEFGDNQLL